MPERAPGSREQRHRAHGVDRHVGQADRNAQETAAAEGCREISTMEEFNLLPLSSRGWNELPMNKALLAEPCVQATHPGLIAGLDGAPRSCTVELTQTYKEENWSFKTFMFICKDARIFRSRGQETSELSHKSC